MRFVADLFGKKFRGAPRDTMFGEMNRLQGRPRGAAPPAASTCSSWRAASTKSKSEQIVVAGYCFGGQCALDLARSGADIAAAVSFHGLFDPPGLPPREDQGQGRRLPRLGRPDGPARQGRRAGPGADRGRLRLADPRLRPCRPRLHQPERAASSRSTASPTTRSPPSGRGPASSTCSRNCSAGMAETS